MRHNVVVVALLCVSATALAQTPATQRSPHWHGGREMVQRMEARRMEQLTVLLELTPAQQQKVKAILATEHARMMQSVRQAMRQMRETHRAVRTDTMKKLSAVLSPQQMRKFKVLLPGPRRVMGAMMMHGMMMRGRDRGPPPPPRAGSGPGPN